MQSTDEVSIIKFARILHNKTVYDDYLSNLNKVRETLKTHMCSDIVNLIIQFLSPQKVVIARSVESKHINMMDRCWYYKTDIMPFEFYERRFERDITPLETKDTYDVEFEYNTTIIDALRELKISSPILFDNRLNWLINEKSKGIVCGCGKYVFGENQMEKRKERRKKHKKEDYCVRYALQRTKIPRRLMMELEDFEVDNDSGVAKYHYFSNIEIKEPRFVLREELELPGDILFHPSCCGYINYNIIVEKFGIQRKERKNYFEGEDDSEEEEDDLEREDDDLIWTFEDKKTGAIIYVHYRNDERFLSQGELIVDSNLDFCDDKWFLYQVSGRLVS
jgi:hypothetical protein